MRSFLFLLFSIFYFHNYFKNEVIGLKKAIVVGANGGTREAITAELFFTLLIQIIDE